jgi:3-oxoacyl-[acyl-carrier protein] reductase
MGELANGLFAGLVEGKMIDPQLEDKVVLITGANHGIGAATARAFAMQGSKVFITYYREPSDYSEAELKEARETGVGGKLLYQAMQQQSADWLVEQIRVQGGVVVAHEADLADPENISLLFDLSEEKLGPVDVLVNNHTYCAMETFDPALVRDKGFAVHLVSAAEIDAHFAVNARAYALMMAEYLKRYLKREADWGRVINLSTDAAHRHEINVSYAASKHAIESYSRSAAAEMGKYGITVNIVAPGPIQTGYLRPEQVAEIAEGAPLRGVGRPEDVADVIVFLASEQARWLTGQLLYVGGGWRMHQ